VFDPDRETDCPSSAAQASAATAAFVIGSGALMGATAHAATSSVIWVDNASGAGCVDAAGSGGQAQPFCTIQAAVNVAQPGDTVEVEPGSYDAQNDITTSGTSSAPITIDAESEGAPVFIVDVAHAFDLTGASNIVISGFQIGATAEPILISGSSDVTVQKLIINNEFETDAFENDQIHVTGDSSGIDISQNVLGMSTSTAVQIDAGGSDPQLTVTSTGALSISVDPANSTDPWGVYGYDIDFGDNSSTGSINAGTTSVTHTYAEPGTYTITLTLEDDGGDNAQTTATYTTAGSKFTAYGPTRILDTRKGLGAAKAKVTNGHDIVVQVAGVGSIPSDATAVAINLTATDTVGNGYVTGESSLTSVGSPSNLNFSAGQTVGNDAILPIDANGDITLSVFGTTTSTAADLIGDVTGYFTLSSGDGYSPVTLDRLLDTRKGLGAPQAKVAANSGVPVTIADADSIPSGVSAVAVHVTVVDTTGNGWIAAEPDGAGTPDTSILNYAKGQTVSNTVIVPVAADGKIELYNGGGSTSVDLLADVTGYFSTTASDGYYPVTPYRAQDTRSSGEKLTAGGTETYSLSPSEAGISGFTIPAGASLVTNLTVVDETANGYITAYPAGTSVPTVSNLNYLKGHTLAGLALLPTAGSAHSVEVYNNSTGSTDLIVDVLGYFTTGQS